MTDDPSNVSGTCPPSRLEQLEDENARLKAEKERLERQLELADGALHQTEWQRNAYLDVLKGIAKLSSDASGLSVEAEERLRTAETELEAAKEQGLGSIRETLTEILDRADTCRGEAQSYHHHGEAFKRLSAKAGAYEHSARLLKDALDRAGSADKEGA